MIYANQKEMKKWERVNACITSISQPYYVSTVFVKWVRPSIYKRFPARLEQEVLVWYNEEYEPVKWDVMVLREQKWNKETKQMEFHRVKVGSDFFKNHAKKFNIKLVYQTPVKALTWDKDAKENREVSDTEIHYSDVAPSKIKDLLNVLDLDTDAKRKEDGNLAYDYEDELYKRLLNKFISFKTNPVTKDLGKWPITYAEYTFKEGKEFELPDSIPQEKTAEPVAKVTDDVPKWKDDPKFKPVEAEINIEDIPF